MASKSHKKIQAILQEAGLPKELSDQIKKELESHFYEKELDLQFKGFKSDDIEQKISEDFGGATLIAKQLELVHKFDFKRFMKKLLIALSIFVFILAFFAPWIWTDRDDILHDTVYIGKGEVFTNPKDVCDSDDTRAKFHWFPFGAKIVDSCFEDYFFIAFWLEDFHINEE